jgi:Capsule assembly protein Wzi/PAP2 superfamily
MIWKLRTGLSLGAIILWMILNPMQAARGQEPESAEKKGEMNPAQQGSSSHSPNSAGTPVRLKKHNWLTERVEDLGGDQKDLWTSPKNLRFSDTVWLVPMSGLAAGLFVTDAESSRHMSKDPTTLSHYKTISDAGIAAMAGGAGLMWAFSYKNHDSHWRETGFLAGEAALNSLIITEAGKYSLRRERPFQGDGSGPFFQNGTSFPSEHAAAAWSIAEVITHEYPGPLTKILAYSAAGLISYSRIRAQQHFSSDVLVGSLIGELSAYTVYKRHHDSELGGDEWESWSSKAHRMFTDPSPGSRGSPYVPLDSWIYPALDRLAGMGLIDSGFAAMRPWTRLECARLVSEAGERIEGPDSPVGEIYRQLQTEFTPELDPDSTGPQARLESAYTRVGYISGMPLNDGYHFAETQINDFGRPFGEGWNTSTGFSFYATAGPWSGYFRGEVQTAPSVAALPLSARQFIAAADQLPGAPPATGTSSIQQFQMLDAYVGLTLANWEFSFGRQSLDWGPGDAGQGGSLMYSDNAAPIDMIRVNRVTPLSIPLVSRFLGPMRAEYFFGQLAGQHFTAGPNLATSGSFAVQYQPQPVLQGGRFSFKPTRNFDFGFSATGIQGGPGVPITLGRLGQIFSVHGNSNSPGSPQDPGDRRSGLDWSYRLPKLRDWATFYGDSFAEDQISPIAYWDRSAIRGGLYFSHLPKLPKLDLRMEGVYTDIPAGGALSHGFFYFNFRFKEGYTNQGQLLASWIGREGQGAQAWTNYWFSARNRLQINFRHQKVSQQFIPGGGTLTDVGVLGDYWPSLILGLTTSIQYERWLFPIIKPGQQQDISASIGIQIQPQKIFRPTFHQKVSDDLSRGDQN